MKVGSWFEYAVSIEETGKGTAVFSERYVLESADGSKLLFRLYCGDGDCGTVEGGTDLVNGIFDRSGLRKERTETLDYSDDKVCTDLLVSDRCGGGERIWLGPDGIAYKDERMQMWSKGAIHRETRTLTAYSIQ